MKYLSLHLDLEAIILKVKTKFFPSRAFRLSQDHLFCNCFSRMLQKIGSRKVVRVLAEKSGSRNLVREKWLTRKRSEFAEPLFQNHVSTLFQNSGCRINGPLGKIISNALKYLSIESYIQAFLDLYLWNLKFRSKYINTLNNSLLATLWSSLPLSLPSVYVGCIPAC